MARPTNQWFHEATFALAQPHANSPELQPRHNDLTQFILAQHAQMPDYLRAPIFAATLGFDALGF